MATSPGTTAFKAMSAWTNPAKQATRKISIDYHLPVPQSFIKRDQKSKSLIDWQEYSESTNNGRHTFDLIPKVSVDLYYLTPHITRLLTEHGPCMSYMHKLTFAITNRCECGELVTPRHPYYNCPLKKNWHIKRPATPPKECLHNILTHSTHLTKIKQIHYKLLYLSNLTN